MLCNCCFSWATFQCDSPPCDTPRWRAGAYNSQPQRSLREQLDELSASWVVVRWCCFFECRWNKNPSNRFWNHFAVLGPILRAFQIFGWICNQIVWMMFSNLLDGIPGKNRTESQRCGTKIEVHKKTHVDGCSTATISREFVFACTGSCFRQRSFVVLTVVRYTTWQ